MDCQKVVISDPLYEEAINDLIQAGEILVGCSHDANDKPCALCRQTWKGTVDNARAIMKGKQILKDRAHGS